MHTPFCTIEQQCRLCNLHRADREIRRLREVLRTTMDALLDKSEEVKDLNNKVHSLEILVENARAVGGWLHSRIELVQRGRISISEIYDTECKLL